MSLDEYVGRVVKLESSDDDYEIVKEGKGDIETGMKGIIHKQDNEYLMYMENRSVIKFLTDDKDNCDKENDNYNYNESDGTGIWNNMYEGIKDIFQLDDEYMNKEVEVNCEILDINGSIGKVIEKISKDRYVVDLGSWEAEIYVDEMEIL